MTDKIIMDVSKWQGNINWAKVKASGKVDGVMLRAMGNSKEGLPSKPYLDPTFEQNYAACIKHGIPVGVYGYFKAATQEQADRELAFFKRLLVGKTVQLPVAVDIEDNAQAALSKDNLTDIVAHCLGTVESWGVYAMLYTGLYFGKDHLYMTGAALKPYDVWLARYPKDQSKTRPEDKPKTDYGVGMWQYTKDGKVPGVSGGVDLSHAYKDYPAIIQRAGLGRVKGA